MSEYKSLTHIIADMMEAKRTAIQNVPRNRKTPRKELPIVGRPDDPDRKSEDRVYTKQAEIQTKVIDETQIAQSKKPVDNVKKPKKLDITNVGKQPPTKVEINPELEKTNVFASAEVKGKLIKEADSVSIQYQTNAGVWVTSRKTDRSPSNILIGMETVQKAHNVNRVRAVDERGSLVDMIAQQPVRAQPVELPFGKMEKPLQTFRNIELPQRPEPVTLGKIARDIGSWIIGEETNTEEVSEKETKKWLGSLKKGAKKKEKKFEKELHKKHWKEEKSYDVPKRLRAGKKDATEWRGGGMAQPIIKAAEKIYNKLTKKKVNEQEYTGKILPFSIDKSGKRSLAIPDWIGGSVKYTGEVMRGETDPKDPKNTGRNLAMAAVAATSAMPPFKASAGALAPEPVAAFQALGNKPKPSPEAKKGVTKLNSETEPARQNIYRTLGRIIEARHSGIETDEPKFSQSIQKVAGHAKLYADVVHTYKHADGSKTKVNQDLGEKIHDKIHSTPHRHRADLIQKMHKSSSHLKDALKESSNRELNVFSGFRSDKGKIKNRSGEAKALENPVFRKRVVKDKTKYSRKEKHKEKRE